MCSELGQEHQRCLQKACDEVTGDQLGPSELLSAQGLSVSRTFKEQALPGVTLPPSAEDKDLCPEESVSVSTSHPKPMS